MLEVIAPYSIISVTMHYVVALNQFYNINRICIHSNYFLCRLLIDEK